LFLVEVLDKPLPKPSEESYVEARLQGALVETRLALRFLREGIARNAAGKAFQAWKALPAALLRLELESLKALAKTEEKKWLETAISVPTTKMKTLSNMLEDLGHAGLAFAISAALYFHDYLYHGPDPDMALSKYATREEAAVDIVRIAAEVAKRVEALKSRVKWNDELEKALEEVKKALPTNRTPAVHK
jgi:PaREP1